MIKPTRLNRWMRPVPGELLEFMERYFEGDRIRLRPPHQAVRAVEGIYTMVLYREPPFQVELVTIAPNIEIPAHAHPRMDSFEVALSGELLFFVDDRQTGYPREPRPDGLSRNLGKFVPIPADAWHAGRSGPSGASFLSVQLWRGEVGYVLENWEGEPLGERHLDRIRP